MAITAALVKELRDSTGAGMMDAKKALTETNGDMEAAVDWLRTKGLAKAAKKSGRTAAEGLVAVAVKDGKGIAVEVNSETDFVGKNDDFVALAKSLAELAINYNDQESFLNANFGGMTVAEKMIEQTGVIGEKVQINDFKKMTAPFVGSYIHGYKIAALVGLASGENSADVVAKDIAMQVASMGASTLSYKDFDPSFIASETEARIAVIEKDNIERGRLGKHLINVPEYISRNIFRYIN